MEIVRAHTACFTGHRHEKLHISEEKTMDQLKTKIERAYTEGYICFITGMVRGGDIWAAELVLDMKKEHPEIHLICAIHYPDFEK